MNAHLWRWLPAGVACAAILSAATPVAMTPVRLITLEPGHFHAALLQRERLPGVEARVHVYAPLGPDLLAHLQRVAAFNQRAEQPTEWEVEVHAGPDYFARLLAERPGNVVVMSGASRDKIARMRALADAGLHVLADKPWIIEARDLPALAETLRLARARRVVAYDMMTQRHEVTYRLQRELVNDPAVFGAGRAGTADEPAVAIESVHYLRKEVSGVPLVRPAWFFDPAQQGEPLADVGTHLVDLVQWILTSGGALDPERDLAVLGGRREVWSLSREQFRTVTGLAEFPASLQALVRSGRLDYVAGNRVDYTLRGVHVRVEARWEYEAPPGGRDTERAVFRGERARVEVRQGAAENFVPEVWVVPNRAADAAPVGQALRVRLAALQSALPGLTVRDAGEAGLHVTVPAALRCGHEAHFALLAREFLAYQQNPDTLPAWETAALLAKYRVTTEGVRLGRLASPPRPATAFR
jgi:predicted dehydrogenase